MCGGQSELNQPDDEARQILESILTQLREKTGHADDGFLILFKIIYLIIASVTLLGYKTQVVAGTNYFLKVSLAEKSIGMWLKLISYFLN